MSTFSLITFNCFGVPAPATHRRLLALAGELNRSDTTVVCLQEVQAQPYRVLLTRACSAYPYVAFEPYFHAPKGGLLTLAREPIAARSFELYRDRGQWYSPALADVALAKGILRTTFVIDGCDVVVLNTHLSANYRGDWANDNSYTRTERRQLLQLAEVIARQPAEAVVIICGDFNVPRGSELYHEFVRAAGVLDPLANHMRPTYRPLPGIPARYALPIDFTFVRPSARFHVEATSSQRFAERVPFGSGQGFLSDHIGLELQVSVEVKGPRTEN